MRIAMSKIFKAFTPALRAIDVVITRMILLFWMSTLQSQLRHERGPQH
jgi:hypothetical protein